MNPSDRPVAATATLGRAAFALSRLRRSPVLRACALLAFIEYGALTVVAVFGGRRSEAPTGGFFPFAGWLAICSLGSWFFLFAWFPFLQWLQREETGDGSALALGRVLETVAIGCVAVVHAMLALILLHSV